MALHATPAVCGDRLCTVEEATAGTGTYVRDGFVYAAIVGMVHVQHGTDNPQPLITVVPHGTQLLVPQPGNQVTVKITRVTLTAAHTQILCVGSKPLEQKFTGVIRLNDVRATEIDKVVMYDSFRPGDIVKAEVLSLGDARSFYLTTAKNELGVVYAKSIAGAALVPVSWQEMQCSETLSREKRKVAKVSV